MRHRPSLVSLLLTGTLVFAACGNDDNSNGTPAAGAKGGKGGSAGAAAAGRAAGGTSGTATTGGKAGMASGGSAQAGTSAGGLGAAGSTTAGAAGTVAAGAAGTTAGSAGSAGVAGVGGLIGMGGEGGGAGAPPAVAPRHVYVGCADSTGTLLSFTTDGTALSPLSTVLAGGAISNSVFNADEDRLYVAHAISATEARVTTYTRDTTTGALTPLGTPADVPWEGPGEGGAGGQAAVTTTPGPQTLTLDAGEDYLAVPNYYSGNVYIYDVLGNGSVGALVASDAGGTNAHHAVFSNNNNYLLVPYLGSNYIKVYNYNDATGAITLDSQTDMPADATGPRHLALHPNGLWLYSINETAGGMDSEAGSIDLFNFSQANGNLTSVATYPVPLPDGYTGLKNGAEIAIAPSGNFLYVSMRLDNIETGEIVVYSIGTSGALTLVQEESSRGVTPRQFSLSSDGSLLIVGNQNSDSVVLFAVNTKTGELTYVTDRDVCDSPRFARFAEIK